MSEVEVTIKVVAFTKASNWLNWKELFLARVNRKDAKMGMCFDLSKPFLLTKEEDGKSVPIEENVMAMRKFYEELLMSMSLSSQDGMTAFQIVKMSKNQKGTVIQTFDLTMLRK